jgi:hypothetical protein
MQPLLYQRIPARGQPVDAPGKDRWVDALVGHQTRPHRDLDLFVDAAAVDDIVS